MVSFTSLKNWLSQQKVSFWIFFVLLVVMRFYPFVYGKTLVFGDNYSLMVPGKIFTAEWLKQGVIPLWNSYIFSGVPWFADINQSVLYPSTLLFMVFSPAIAFNFLLMGHALIAYVGMYLLTREWMVGQGKNEKEKSDEVHNWSLLAGAFWMLSTQVSGSMNNFSTLQSLVWLPLVAYWGLRLFQYPRAKVWFAVTVMFQFLGGYPQHVLYSILLAVGLSAFQFFQAQPWKKTFISWLKAWSITAFLVLSFSAIAWIPFVDMLLESTRMEQTAQQALVGSLHPAMLVKFLLPYFFDNPSVGMKWGPAWSGQPNVGIYVSWLGVVVMFFSLFTAWKKAKNWSRERLLFFLITVGTLAFSLGQYLPGFNIIQSIFPLFRIARYPSMVMIVTNIVMILWAVRSLQKVTLSRKQFTLLWVLGVMGMVAGAVGVLVAFYGFDVVWNWFLTFVFPSLSSSPFHTVDRDKIILLEISRNILYNSLFFIASLYFFCIKKTRIVALLLAVELLINTQGLFYFAPTKIYDTETENSQKIKTGIGLSQQGFDGRILTRNSNTPYTDYGSYWEAMVVRVPFSDSFVDAEELQNFDHAQNLKDSLTPNWNMVFGVPTVHGYATLLPQDYAHIWQTSDSPRINFIDSVDPHNILLDQWSVKYYLVDTWFKVTEDLQSFPVKAVVGTIEKPSRWQIRERLTALPRFRWEDGTSEGIAVMGENPQWMELVLTNHNSESSSLIIADRYDKNWKVFVNGKEKTLENMNGMRKISLNESDWSGAEKLNVVMVYYPQWLIVGMVVTSISIFITAGVWGKQARQKDTLWKKKTKKNS